MAGDVFIVLIIFSAIVLTVRAVADGIVRAKALKSDAAAAEVLQALSRAMVPPHVSALKWGLCLGFLGAGFLIIDLLGLDGQQPASWGVISLSIAAGLLAFYGISRAKPD